MENFDIRNTPLSVNLVPALGEKMHCPTSTINCRVVKVDNWEYLGPKISIDLVIDSPTGEAQKLVFCFFYLFFYFFIYLFIYLFFSFSNSLSHSNNTATLFSMTSVTSNATLGFTADTHLQMTSEKGEVFGFFLQDLDFPEMEGSIEMSGVFLSVEGDVFGFYADDVEVFDKTKQHVTHTYTRPCDT